MFTENFVSGSTGNAIRKPLPSNVFLNGANNLKAVLKNDKGEIILTSIKQFTLANTAVLSPADNSAVRVIQKNSHQLEFGVEGGLTGEVTVFSMEGKNVYTGSLFDGKQIDLPKSGIYIVKMVLDTKISTIKIVLY